MEKPPNNSSDRVSRRVGTHHYDGAGGHDDVAKDIAVEVPVSLTYKGTSHVVMMASPDHLEDFGLGFSLSEGIINRPGELTHIDVMDGDKGVIVAMDIPNDRHKEIAERRRYLSGRTGCGLCGVESLDEAVPELTPLSTDVTMSAAAIHRGFDLLHRHQR